MKVYRVDPCCEIPDGNGGRKQVLASLGGQEGETPRFMLDEFHGKPFSRQWKPIRYWLDKPLLHRPDFYGLVCAFICSERALTVAGEPLEMCGELLPVEIEGERGEFRLFHVTNCINVLDRDKSRWRTLGPSKHYKHITETFTVLEKPAFNPERFGEETLFKIPEDAGVSTYCLERSGDPDDGEFKALVERQGLTGLQFEFIWSDDNHVA
jgi:hypothetical protein